MFRMEDVKRDKTKAFKASGETIEKIDDIIKKSGKGPTEFFEDLVYDLAIKNVVGKEDEGISTDLRKHFESDVQKLKNATNSILSIFVSQMENISVEKNQWQATAEKQLNEKQLVIEEVNNKYSELKVECDENVLRLTESSKVNETLTKERDTLLKRTEDLEQLVQDRAEKIQEQSERINKLNENIVDKDGQLKLVEPIKEKRKKLEEDVRQLIKEKQELITEHEEEIKKTIDTLTFSFEKEKHELEFGLTNQFNKEKEELRNEVRRETEKNIKEFYLSELKRERNEHKKELEKKELAHEQQIKELKERSNHEIKEILKKVNGDKV